MFVRMEGDYVGADCLRGDPPCAGVLVSSQEDCCCHLHPPCWHCENHTLRCPVCGWDERD